MERDLSQVIIIVITQSSDGAKCKLPQNRVLTALYTQSQCHPSVWGVCKL